MDLGLKGKIAVVSGSTAGLGFAIANTLAAEGVQVIVNGRTQARVDAAVKKIREETSRADVRGVAGDLSTADGVQAFTKQVTEADILINNLGIFEPKPFAEIVDADWLRFFEANVMSGVRLSRQYLPGMLRKNWGRIIFISSESGQQIPAEMIHYGMTKTAQIAVARGIAESVAGTGITVNSVLAGPTRSEGVETFIAQMGAGGDAAAFEAEFFKTIRPTSLLKRFATIDEVATMIVYLCSPLASATTGAAIRADGGVVRAIL